MKHRSFVFSATLIFLCCTTAVAGPARPITSGTFLTPIPSGPALDPMALQGQWFVELASGSTNVNSMEYCDDDNHLTIAGVVTSISSNALSNIVAFDILATVSNSLPGDYQTTLNATNSHGEVQQPQAPAAGGTMRQTRITAEFAIADISMLPGGTPPYWLDPISGGQYYIEAVNEDLWAWYCWSPNSGQQPAGQFQVPAWNLNPSDIPPGGTAQVLMQFIVTGNGIPMSDYRNSVLRASKQLGLDVLYNRHPSLKISHWLDTLLIDNGTYISTGPLWEEEPIEYQYASDASVFYNGEEMEFPNKMHWPQLPDPNGWDVRACNWEEQAGGDGQIKILADDFRCTESGPITNITFWGSFRYDEYETEQPFHGITNFHLSLHNDIPDPDGHGPEFSKPALPPNWEANINPYNPPPGWTITVEQEIIDSNQGWYDPNNPQNTEHPNHMNYFRYEVSIPPSEAFFQVVSNIYWLDISVLTQWPQWGWKTSGSPHFMDDAVWADRPVQDITQWQELIDPYTEESLDLAFVIDGGEEEPPAFDFGDAPDWVAGTGPGDYQTILADTGAYHNIVAGAPYFDDGSGSDQPDGEPDGQPDPNALGDDNNGTSPDDEDGIFFPAPLVAGQNGSVDITVDDGAGGLGAGGGYVYAWIDFNADGDWTDSNEQIYGGWATQGLNQVNFAVPASAVTGPTFARFRIQSASTSLQPTGGPAQDGEVEDHEVFIEEPPQDLDYGDAPTNYPTLLVHNGARHALSGLNLGNLIDLELDGQPTPFADGDDANNMADEDGIVFLTALISGSPAAIQATVTGSGGLLQGWADWNADGDWADASEQILTDAAVINGTNTLNFPIPTWVTNQSVYMRFRLSSTPGLPDNGYAQDGEVEDYLVGLEPLKWLQVPEQGKEGVDVNNTYNQLADDFLCMASGPITDIHIWGSFYNDILPPEGPDELIFKLSIWSDVPKGADADYSHPGIMLWSRTFAPGTYSAAKVWTVPEGEWWHDPGTTTWIHPGDFNIYQFDFYPLPTEAFVQIEGTIYWLAVEYFYEGEGVEFGWKTTPDAFNDDACYADPALPVGWKDLVYGPTHERSGESLELAFALSGEEGDVEDWGDAPDPAYPTLSASVGARHIILTNFYLGNRIDAELDGQPSATANGDDLAAFDDEDGVSFGASLIRGSSTAVNVILNSGIGNGALDAWIDFDGSGSWSGGERIFSSVVLSNGNNVLSFITPTNAVLGTNYARFRLTLSGIATPGGAATEGEVEDYQVIVLQPQPSTNFVITNITVTASNNLATVQWNAQTSITYQMQSTTNLLISNSWINVGGYVVGPLNTQTNSAAPTNQFYRIMAPWTP